MSVTVKKISFDELRQAAVDIHNEYYESRAEKAGNFHIDIQLEDVPEDILQEWMIALIQDEMVSVEGEFESYASKKIAILKAIKEVYPELTEELNRHLSIFESRL